MKAGPRKICPKCLSENFCARKTCSNRSCKHVFYVKQATGDQARIQDFLKPAINKENMDSGVIGYSKSCRPIKRPTFFSSENATGANDSKNNVFKFLQHLPRTTEEVKKRNVLDFHGIEKETKWYKIIRRVDRVKSEIHLKEKQFYKSLNLASRIKMDLDLKKINSILTKSYHL